MVVWFVLAAYAALAVFPLWLLTRALRRGAWNLRGIEVSRDERPATFWFGIVGYAVSAAIVVSMPAYFAWRLLSTS